MDKSKEYIEMCEKAKEILHKSNYNFDILDVSANGISAYLYEDME